MTAYIFFYNVVAIKATLSEVSYDGDSQFILIASDYCIDKLSKANKCFFNHIHRVKRNFHQIDFYEAEMIVLDYLTLYKPHEIRLLTNEDSTQLVCAQLREKYNIPGIKQEQVWPYVDKVVSKNKLKGKISIPKFVLFNRLNYQSSSEQYINNLIQQIGFPMFIKPVDLVSSIGTYYVPDKKTLCDVLKYINQASWAFEIDQFIEGELFHCDVIVYDNEIKFFMAGQYANPLAKFSKGSPMGSIPVPQGIFFNKLKEFSMIVLHGLGIFSSAFHIEIFKDKDTGNLIFLEAAARTPGALVPEMYEIILNHHLEALHYSVQTSCLDTLQINPTDYQAGWITFPQIKGRLTDIIKPDIAINHDITYLVKIGEELNQANSLLDGSCNVIFWDKSYQNIEQTFELLKHHKLLTFSPPT